MIQGERPRPLTELEEKAAREAGLRWQKRTALRKRQINAADRGEYTKADTRPRLQQRIKRLQKTVATRMQRAGSFNESALDAVSLPPLTTDAVINLALERVIGETRDFLSIEYFERGLQAAACVGRIMPTNNRNGTGFLVAPDIVITNNHVIATEAAARGGYFELDYEANTFGSPKIPQNFELDPDSFFITDVPHDFSLIGVKNMSQNGKALADYGHLALIADEGKVTIGEPVNVIQHPKSRFKQIAIRSRLVDLFENAEDSKFFHYLSDTEQGSSGAPVLNDQWEVIALHHQAVPKTNDSGQLVDADEMPLNEGEEDRIVWVANEGIRVSRLVQTIQGLVLPSSEREERRKKLLALWLGQNNPGAEIAPRQLEPIASPSESAPSPDHLADRAPTRPAQPAPTAESAPAASPCISAANVGPLRIEISIGGTAAHGSATALTTDLRFDEATPPDPADPDYRRRGGYKPGFLGFDAPLPRLADPRHGPLLTIGQDPAGELRYHHFSVLMNARRRLAYVAACNLDASAPFQHKRGKGSERWLFDPRIPASLQAGAVYYTANPLDRGHLVRRDDAAWGMDASEARLANDDTFHWTNCSPQHEIFNQAGLASSRGLKLWGNLENAVSALAPAHGSRLSVFNGPVFSDGDKPHGQDFFLPAAFWKVIMVKDDAGRPRALAFVLSQAQQLDALVNERFAPAALADFEAYQLPIARLAARTGLDFGVLAGWDPMAPDTGSRAESDSPAGAAVLLANEAAIRL